MDCQSKYKHRKLVLQVRRLIEHFLQTYMLYTIPILEQVILLFLHFQLWLVFWVT